MLLDLLLTFGGFALLLWGADRFVAGAEVTASYLGVPPLLIGLTIVGFATSAPEIVVAASAASSGLTNMAVGNALGSNIANIGLVLGTTAVIRPICGHLSKSLSSELPLLVLLTPATMLLFLDHRLSRIEAGILLGCMILFLAWMARLGIRLSNEPDGDQLAADVVAEIPRDMSKLQALVWLLFGFVVLIAGAQMLVTGAESLARAFGISNLVIGLTVVAVGTSLPELAVSVVAALKGETGIAVGNVIGSNVFNLLAVVGVAGWINPASLDSSILSFHYPVMIAFTVPLLFIAYNPFGQKGLGRGMGIVLLIAFFAYHTALLSGAI